MSPDNNCSGQLQVELRIKAMQPVLIPGPFNLVLLERERVAIQIGKLRALLGLTEWTWDQVV